MGAWAKVGRGRQSDAQRRALDTLQRAFPDRPVIATLTRTGDAMHVEIDERVWRIDADGTARETKAVAR
jgi:hypothetical protein